MTAPAIYFVIDAPPVPQKRHRDAKGGRFKYDPCRGDKKRFAALAEQFAPAVPFDEPLRVDIDFWLPRPGSHFHTGKKRGGEIKETAPLYCDKKVDRDNLDKFVLDALQGLFWQNDSRVCDGRIRKLYSVRPRTVVSIYRLQKGNEDARNEKAT